MKKCLPVIMLLGVLALSGCSAAPQEEKASEMYIEAAQLTEEEQNIADLLGANTDQHIYDFRLDDTVRSVQVNTYQLTDGAWDLIAGGGGESMTDTEGRLALAFDHLPAGLRIAVQSEGNSSSTTYSKGAVEDYSGMGTATSALSDRTEIVYGEEIPLIVQIITSKNEIISYSVDYFAQPEEYARLGYEHVYAITVRFSQETVSQISREPLS